MPGKDAGSPQRLVLYGSLRRGEPAFRRLKLDRALTYCGPCLLRGTLYDLGRFPGFVADGRQPIHADLFEVGDAAVLRRLDEFEDYRPEDAAGSLYLRRLISLWRPAGEAWIYVYNRDPGPAPVVASGDWLAYRTSSGGNDGRPIRRSEEG